MSFPWESMDGEVFLFGSIFYLRVALEPLRLLELELEPELEELRLLELLLEELRVELEPVEVPLLRVLLLEPPTRLLPEGRLLEFGRLTPLPLVVGRVEGPLLLDLGRLTPLVPELGRLEEAEPVEVPLLVPLGRLMLPLDGVLPPLLLVAGGGVLPPLSLLWLPPELMLPPLAFGRTVALGAVPLGAGSLLLGAGGFTSWVAG